MAYYMNVGGMEELSETLDKLEERAPAVAAHALYDGAGIMADEIKSEVKNIQTEEFHYAVFPGVTTRLPSPEEKEIVEQAAAGIAKFRKTGSEVNTSVGFRNAGYATLKGRTVPIPKIVNAINSGTSFMKKQPFIRKAASSATKRVTDAIVNTIEQKSKERIE